METVIKGNCNSLNYGKIVSVRGSVVDILFKENLPAIYTILYTGKNNEIAIEVLSQLDAQRVRGIALTPERVYLEYIRMINYLLKYLQKMITH